MIDGEFSITYQIFKIPGYDEMIRGAKRIETTVDENSEAEIIILELMNGERMVCRKEYLEVGFNLTNTIDGEIVYQRTLVSPT